MTVVGSEKMVVYDDTSPDARIRLYDKGITRQLIEQRPSDASLGRFETFAQFQLLLRAGDMLVPKIDFVEPLQLELEDFVAAVRGERVPMSTAQTGLDVVRTLEAAQRSLESAGASVPV
jgi:predicted dehydrogenase